MTSRYPSLRRVCAPWEKEDHIGKKGDRDVHLSPELSRDQFEAMIDISPYTFGTSAVGVINGEFTETMFDPLIQRNTTFPGRKGEAFYTLGDNRKALKVMVYQDVSAMARCPTCRARLTEARGCHRCQTDIGRLRDIDRKAREHYRQAMVALMAEDYPRMFFHAS